GKRRAVDDHAGTEIAGVLDLGERRALGHADRRGYTEPLGVIGHSLRMVARRHRDDATLASTFIQRQKLVERAALLERSSELEIFEFEENLRAGDGRKGPRMAGGRQLDRAGDRLGRPLDVHDTDGKSGWASSHDIILAAGSSRREPRWNL